MRRSWIAMVLFAAGCSSAEPGLTPGQKPALEKRNAELAVKHDEIWNLMGLSKAAKDELNAVVARINTQMTENRARKPEEYDKVFKESKRKENITHETYVADHVKRWQTLKLSDGTQKELLAAAEFCWTALHDPNAKLTREHVKTPRSSAR
jgi:ElaB/YqjD/DUF883 family membrane-anchored ribosome-binding protein